MKTVATVIDTNISALIGPTKNIKRLYDNADLFEENGISLVGPYFPGGEAIDGDEYRSSSSFRLKALVKKMLPFSATTSWLLYCLTHRRNAKAALDKYFAETDDAVDLVVFRDAACASEYLRRGGTSPFVLVLHCDGTNDMIYSGSAFPKLAGTKYQRILDDSFENVCAKATGLLFLSPRAIEKHEMRYGSRSCPLGYYHQGLDKPKVADTLDYCPRHEGITFVSVGTVCGRKNQIGIVRSFAQMHGDDNFLIIVGGGEDLPRCEELARELGVDDRVMFTGPTQNVGDYLALGDVFVSASLDEGVPNAAVEAMAFGLPLILTDVGSCADLINGNGILLSDPTGLEMAMNKICKEADLCAMGAKSEELYNSYYTVDAMCREHSFFYKRVIDYSEGKLPNDR